MISSDATQVVAETAMTSQHCVCSYLCVIIDGVIFQYELEDRCDEFTEDAPNHF